MMLTTRYKRSRDQRSCRGPALDLTLTRKRVRLSVRGRTSAQRRALSRSTFVTRNYQTRGKVSYAI